jgi:hypothetical protein
VVEASAKSSVVRVDWSIDVVVAAGLAFVTLTCAESEPGVRLSSAGFRRCLCVSLCTNAAMPARGPTELEHALRLHQGKVLADAPRAPR